MQTSGNQTASSIDANRITGVMRFNLPALVASLVLVWGSSSSIDAADTAGVELRCDSLTASGARLTVGVAVADSSLQFGGFNLLIAYDRAALVFDSASLGSLTRQQWEYFTYREDLLDPQAPANSLAGVRLVAIADQADDKNRHPSPRSLRGPGELARLFFTVNLYGQRPDSVAHLRFVWSKCDDNSFSDLSGTRLYVAAKIADPGEIAVEPIQSRFVGPSPTCFRKRTNAPLRVLKFHNVAVRIL